jgi:hypothetical protein
MVKFTFERRAAQRGLLKFPLYAPRGFSVGLRGGDWCQHHRSQWNIKFVSLTTYDIEIRQI